MEGMKLRTHKLRSDLPLIWAPRRGNPEVLTIWSPRYSTRHFAWRPKIGPFVVSAIWYQPFTWQDPPKHFSVFFCRHFFATWSRLKTEAIQNPRHFLEPWGDLFQYEVWLYSPFRRRCGFPGPEGYSSLGSIQTRSLWGLISLGPFQSNQRRQLE